MSRSSESGYSFHSGDIENRTPAHSPSEQASGWLSPASPVIAGGTPSAVSAGLNVADDLSHEMSAMGPQESPAHPHYYPDESPSRAPTPPSPISPVEPVSPATAPDLLPELSSWSTRHSPVAPPKAILEVSIQEFAFMNNIEAREDIEYLGTYRPAKCAPEANTPSARYNQADLRRSFVERVADAREIGARFKDALARTVVAEAAAGGLKRSARIAALDLKGSTAQRFRRDDENSMGR